MTNKQPFSDVAGKMAVITGAARGLGQGTAETLAAHGVHVVIADILPDVHDTFAAIKEAHPENEGYSRSRTPCQGSATGGPCRSGSRQRRFGGSCGSRSGLRSSPARSSSS